MLWHEQTLSFSHRHRTGAWIRDSGLKFMTTNIEYRYNLFDVTRQLRCYGNFLGRQYTCRNFFYNINKMGTKRGGGETAQHMAIRKIELCLGTILIWIDPRYHRVFVHLSVCTSYLSVCTSLLLFYINQLIAWISTCNIQSVFTLYNAHAHADICQLFTALLFQSHDRVNLISVACDVAIFVCYTVHQNCTC